MLDVVDWTEPGRKMLALAAIGEIPCTDGDERLRERIAATIARDAPAWERGIPNSDEKGKRAVHFAVRWTPEGPPISVDDAAGMASLLGARVEGGHEPFIELMIRERGFAFPIHVLVTMWSLYTQHKESEVCLYAIAPTHSAAMDASVSYARGRVARYLQQRYRAAPNSDRTAMKRAVDEIWDATPLASRAPLAVSTDDSVRAEEIARALLASKDQPYPHWPWRHLPPLLGVALLEQLGEEGHLQLSYDFLRHFGVDALRFYERAIDRKQTRKYQRDHLVEQLVNIRGPRTARILARFAERAPNAEVIREYFARAPDLLDTVLADDDLVEKREQLMKLKKKFGRRQPSAS